MGYCTYGGKPVPINDQAGCIGSGGNWVDDIAPIQRGGVNIQHPYSQANNDQLTALSNVTGAGTLGKVVPRIGAGLPGRFTGQPNTVQQVQRAAQPIQGPAQQKLTDIGKIGATTPTKLQRLDNAVYKAGQYAGQHPIKAAAAASSVGVPAYNIFNSGEPVADKQVVQNNTPVNQQSPILNREQLQARNIAVMKEQNAAEAPTVPPTAPTTNKKNDGLLVDGLTGDDLKGVAKSGDIPTSMWDKMQTKGYWLDGVEGGSGKWDNRLFRLGEMMTHMGTPLSKQGDSPAKRWSTANTAANTLKATNAKAADISAGKITDAQRKSWVAMIPNETTLIKQFLKDKPGIISDSAPGTKEYANAASKAANYVWIGNQLIGDGIEPTPSNIQKRAKKIKDEKK